MKRFSATSAILWLPLILPAYVVRFHVGPLSTTALEVAFLLTAIFATFQAPTIWKKGWQALTPFRMAGGLWLLATIIAVIVAPNHLAALGLWRAFVLEPMAYALLLAGAIATDADRRTALHALAWSVIGVTVMAVVQFATGTFIPHPWDTDLATRRATGPFPYPNALALYVAPIAALCIGALTLSRDQDAKTANNDRWILLGASIAGLMSIAAAKSVGGCIGFMSAVLIALLWKPRTRTATIIIAILGATAILSTPLESHIRSTLAFNEWSGRVRTVMWNETIQMLSTRQFFGAGFGAYPDVIKPYHHATWMEIFQYPHNILLNLWSETGLLGLVAFTGICVTWTRRSLQNKKNLLFLLPLIAIIIHGIVDVPYFKNDLAFVFWTFIAILATMSVNQSNDALRNE